MARHQQWFCDQPGGTERVDMSRGKSGHADERLLEGSTIKPLIDLTGEAIKLLATALGSSCLA
jgi:hypothetical protein